MSGADYALEREEPARFRLPFSDLLARVWAPVLPAPPSGSPSARLRCSGARSSRCPMARCSPGACVLVALILLAGVFTGTPGPAGRRLRQDGPWAIALGLFVGAWGSSRRRPGGYLPFFPSPQALVEVYAEDWPRLLDSIAASGWLLVRGLLFGALIGFSIGVAMGWWRRAGYWIHPVLRLIGPVPATAWLPIIFFVFPTSASASVFVIALATAFPVAVLTWSGVASVNRDYYDIAGTLGASERVLIARVAIPAALPHLFVGLFVGVRLILRGARGRRDARREIRPRGDCRGCRDCEHACARPRRFRRGRNARPAGTRPARRGPRPVDHPAMRIAGLTRTAQGTSAVIALAAFVLAAASLRRRAGFGTALLTLALAAAPFAASGHAATASPRWLTQSAVFLHAAAMTLWRGALMPLAALAASARSDVKRSLRRFSDLIPYGLVVLLGSGLALAIVQLGSPAALLTTPYGQVLLIKLGLLTLVLALANRLLLTPRSLCGHVPARRRLAISIAVETALCFGVLAAAGAWLFIAPPRRFHRPTQAPMSHCSTTLSKPALPPDRRAPAACAWRSARSAATASHLRPSRR